MTEDEMVGWHHRCNGHDHREPSKAGPGLHAPPRSKPLRFRHARGEGERVLALESREGTTSA